MPRNPADGPVRLPDSVCRKIEARLLLEAEKAASEALGVPEARLTAWNEAPKRRKRPASLFLYLPDA